MNINAVRQIALLFLPILLSFGASAQLSERTLRDFTVCDDGFFKSLHREKNEVATIAPMESAGELSWIKVPNRNEEHLNNFKFQNLPTVANLKLLSYFDEVSDLGSMGMYYYWGFMVSGTVDEVLAKLKPLVHDSGRLRKGDPEYVRTEVKVGNSRWFSIATPSNTPAGLEKVERVFLIEPEEKVANTVRVSCSLQGGVNGAVLREVRPDIKPADYPVRLTPSLFDEMPVADAALKALNQARAEKDIWIPKFKKLTYRVISTNLKSRKESGWNVEMEAEPNGLLRIRETYSADFNVQRLMLAYFVQLKSRMNGLSDGRVYVTNALSLTLPVSFEPGLVLSGEIEGQNLPPQGTGANSKMGFSWNCAVKEKYDASTIFPAFTGKAVALECSTKGAGEGTDTRAFIEDLGIMVTLSSSSASLGTSTQRLTNVVLLR